MVPIELPGANVPPLIVVLPRVPVPPSVPALRMTLPTVPLTEAVPPLIVKLPAVPLTDTRPLLSVTLPTVPLTDKAPACTVNGELGSDPATFNVPCKTVHGSAALLVPVSVQVA